MQISAPTPIYYLPENLWSFFTRPGRELAVRVLQIEGKLLYLELGGHKFQARLAGTLNPEDFVPGEVLKVKVLKTEGPVVLEVMESSRGKGEANLLYLLVKGKERDSLSPQVLAKEARREAIGLTEMLKLLVQKAGIKEKREGLKNIEEFLGKEIELSDFFLEEDRVFMPFLLQDKKSWGYLEILPPKEKAGKVRIFLLKLFLQYLGYVEGIFYYTDDSLEIDLFFSEKGAWEWAKEYLRELRKELSFSSKFVKINLEKREVSPGQILERIG